MHYSATANGGTIACAQNSGVASGALRRLRRMGMMMMMRTPLLDFWELRG